MNYQQTLDYLYDKLPMFSRDGGQAIKPGFANIIALCELLDNPHKNKKFIHVAGTNGKGSVSHMLASILQSAGYKTGLYTSPHLKDFRERIKIGGQMIPEKDVVAFVERIMPEIEKIQPSFFEITVAMAFHYFANNNIDVAVIETGMGGRLDSTNIINPLLSVITNIGFDHMQFLGDTLEKIAFEKAGIIKPKVPVVLGEHVPETASVFKEVAMKKDAPFYFANEYYQMTEWEYENNELVIQVAEAHKVDHHKYYLDLSGQYQTKNLLTVLESCRHLKAAGFDIPDAAIAQGLRHVKKQTGLHGRWDTIQQNPKVIVDVAHNESGVREVLNQLEITTYHRLHLILGMVKDKDVKAVLQLLPPHAICYFTNADIPRALPAGELQALAAKYNLQGNVFINVNEALAEAKAHAHTDDLIIIFGSVFLVGEIS
ncbi:bifunctional folylpolyglutamate synthase/dihydrofolate synthase [Niabella ginsengisoli]|uniref:Dihydrofolate synthase/folylpolyglutamate synthase n=1 Tax=Niabella ginsengisoli TaxID=522298 RepID=A0ABS9SEJ3_9BACT|nr:folylpolyglutamate synthase/dihydrofolate synthase family protein [Niabella ginsengisoli]MCH5596784.1 bifunctional folylpolyglutamate synthase/dihydrofolate synthase [Niabella ginsengisoli]